MRANRDIGVRVRGQLGAVTNRHARTKLIFFNGLTDCGRLVQRMLLFVTMLSVGAGSAGCLIPVDFQSIDENPPVIDLNGVQPDVLVPVVLNQQASAPSTFVLVVTDPDPQTLFVRLFVNRDYSSFLGGRHFTGRSEIPDFPAQPDDPRALAIQLRGLCDEPVQSVEGQHTLELYVADAPFVGSGRAVEQGGLRDNAVWSIICDPPLEQGP